MGVHVEDTLSQDDVGSFRSEGERQRRKNSTASNMMDLAASSDVGLQLLQVLRDATCRISS
jgi:hypothetical protein